MSFNLYLVVPNDIAMRIKLQEYMPTLSELSEVVKTEMPASYTVDLFQLPTEQGIFVAKSAFVAARIFIRGDEVIVEGSSKPSVFLSLLGILDMILFYGSFIAFTHKKERRQFEREIGLLLAAKYKLSSTGVPIACWSRDLSGVLTHRLFILVFSFRWQFELLFLIIFKD